MTVYTEGRHAGEFILSLANGDRSLDNVTIASGQGVLAAGTVLTLDGTEYKAANAAQFASAILFDTVDATSASVKAVVVARDAEVKGVVLTGYNASGHQPDLIASGIVVR